MKHGAATIALMLQTFNSCSKPGKFKNLNNNNVKHVTKFQRREVGAPLSSY